MKILKQSTAVTVKVGPFLDSTDGITAETALTLSQSDCLLSKNHGAFAQKNDANAATHDAGGWYACALNATDTNTLGPLKLSIQESGAVPVWDEWLVLPANVFDSLMGTDLLQVDTREINGSAAAALQQALAAGEMTPFTVTNAGFTPTSTDFETADIVEATADHYRYRSIIFTSGAMKGQATRITASQLVSGRQRFTVQQMTEAPANGVTALIV